MAYTGIEEPTSAHRRVFQDAAVVGVLTSITKMAAAAKVIVTARYFGASDDVDAFLIAFLLPTLVVETAAGTFTTSLVPSLIRSRTHRSMADTVALAQASLAVIGGAMLTLGLVLALGARAVLPLLGSSFSDSKLNLTTALFWSMLMWLPLAAASATWRAVLNAHGRVAMSTAVYSAAPAVTILLLLTVGAKWGVWSLAVANTAGVTIEFAALAIAVRQLGYRLTPRWFGWTPDLRAVLSQYWPILAGTAITTGCALVDQAVAGGLGSGSVAVLAYGIKVTGVLVAVGGTGMATAVLPEFSRLVSQERWETLRHGLRVQLGAALALMVPVTVGMIWFSTEIVQLIYQGGQFDTRATVLVAEIQRYSLLVVPFAVVLIIAHRLAAAIGATSLILRAGVLAMLTNVVGDWLLPRWMGVSGVALSSTIAFAANMVLTLGLLYLREPRLFRTVTR